MSNPDRFSALFRMLLSFSYNSKIEDDIVIETSITAPKDPTSKPAINTTRYGRVRKSIASYRSPLSEVSTITIYVMSNAENVPKKVVMIDAYVFSFLTFTSNNEVTVNKPT